MRSGVSLEVWGHPTTPHVEPKIHIRQGKVIDDLEGIVHSSKAANGCTCGLLQTPTKLHRFRVARSVPRPLIVEKGHQEGFHQSDLNTSCRSL